MILPRGINQLMASLEKEVRSLKRKKIIIAIDGHSSSGKSTLSKDLARTLEMVHIDTGAMYRAVTLYFINKEIPIDDEARIENALREVKIQLLGPTQGNRTILNDLDVSQEIRSIKVNNHVSEVAANSQVRRFLVEQQRALAQQNSVIMDGRDIGTVVFPDADVKLFVTASIEERTQRRYLELKEKGIQISLDEVASNLSSRDEIDSTREDSPLRRAEDAYLLDTSFLDRNTMLSEALKYIITQTSTTKE